MGKRKGKSGEGLGYRHGGAEIISRLVACVQAVVLKGFWRSGAAFKV